MYVEGTNRCRFTLTPDCMQAVRREVRKSMQFANVSFIMTDIPEKPPHFF